MSNNHVKEQRTDTGTFRVVWRVRDADLQSLSQGEKGERTRRTNGRTPEEGAKCRAKPVSTIMCHEMNHKIGNRKELILDSNIIESE